jgi:hypothetical protein
VVLGKVSGGLSCRDFDTTESYQLWKKQKPELAEKLPTVETSRGYHVYFLDNNAKNKKFDDGELRSDGCYMLLPPSVHPNGVIYKWQIPPSKTLMTASLSDFVVSPDVITTEMLQREHKRTERIQEINIYSNKALFDDIFKRTLPQKEGTRHYKVFNLVRELRSLPQFTDADPKIFRPIVKEWHRLALPNIKTKEFEETWIDFLKGWSKMTWKIGENPLSKTFEEAKKLSLPDFAMVYENPKLRLLINWCKVLNSFFLSVRSVGKFLAVDSMTASRWLFLLEQDGILKLVEKGKRTKEGDNASRFRYIAKE